ncbi:PREDICTED: uncharacterized protein LOC105959905 [Erythranthe guttata]|nr:PREDICTED: uncharacterized protein LOC105959905 [Erythranthe guttata]|eukprot:XP_012839520.1 PREDICTED: uncharacterized protein LOC105959905 [Erythranthe guttata]
MLKETLKWRIQYRPDKIKWDDIAQEAARGKIYRANYSDKNGRTVLVMRPGLQNSNSVEEQIKCLVYCMESAISNLDEDQEQMVWLIDFQKWNMASISVKVTRETARVLQDHYPERLGIAVFYNPPKVFESFWLMVKPFLETKTYKKVKFVYSDHPPSMKVMEALFDMEKLESTFGGKNAENYDYESYAERMKKEEKQKYSKNFGGAKKSGDGSPSDRMSVVSEVTDSDFLASEVCSQVSDEADFSYKNEIGSYLEGLDEIERLQIDCKDNIDGGDEVSPTAFFTILALMYVTYKVVSGMFVAADDYAAVKRANEFALREPVQMGDAVTEEELRAYDGSDPNKPLLMAIKGQIYDVSRSRMFYGPGGPYALFAGRDASRALALMSFEPTDLTGNVEGLSESELEVLQDWEYKFMEKYVKVGQLVSKTSAPKETENEGEASKLHEDKSEETRTE